ncbi:MAG: Ppx/GppA family phosphatase [Clostridia bacterium]|nr:Ppx/GppA family phosphatase [Clostridia bacterium]
MKKVACIDIGTNSVRMVILNSHTGIEAEKHMVTTRIGRGVDKTRELSQEAVEDTLAALMTFKEIAEAENVDEFYAIATSAVRDAKNGSDFIRNVYEKTGITVEVISGSEEARLGFLGVSKGLSHDVKSEDHLLVVDIGGGSTELIVGHGGEIDYSISLDVGAVRLSDKFITSDPVDLNEQQDMSDFIRITIKDALAEIMNYDIKFVVGIGGTITTAGSMNLEMIDYDRQRVHNYFVPLEDLHHMNRKLLSQTIEERKQMPGLQPKRADIIPCGFMILQQILLKLEKSGIVISEYDNLEGLYFDKSKAQ